MTTTLGQTRPDIRKPGLPHPFAVLAIVPTGLLVDQTFHASAAGISATAALIALAWCASLGPSARWRPQSWWAFGSVSALAVWLSVRTSPWVVTPIVVTCLLIIAGAPAVKSMESFVSRQRLHWTTSVIKSVEAGALAGGNSPAHLIITFIGMTGAAWLAVAAVQPNAVLDPVAGPERTATAEATLVLMTITVVLAAFSISQVATIARGRDFIVSRTDTTFADYARQGFFQLLISALIVTGVLLATRLMTGSDRRRPAPVIARLFIADAVFTIGLVLVAIRRLAVYEAQFGLTMLRLMSTLAATWLGLATILIVSATVGNEWLRRRLPVALMASIVVGIIVLAALNPERVVVERNLDRLEAGRELDLGYLTSLSPDGLVALRDGLEDLTSEDAARLFQDDPVDLQMRLRVEKLCEVDPTRVGWANWSLARAKASNWWRSICR